MKILKFKPIHTIKVDASTVMIYSLTVNRSEHPRYYFAEHPFIDYILQDVSLQNLIDRLKVI
jgi:hypothetical protein